MSTLPPGERAGHPGPGSPEQAAADEMHTTIGDHGVAQPELRMGDAAVAVRDRHRRRETEGAAEPFDRGGSVPVTEVGLQGRVRHDLTVLGTAAGFRPQFPGRAG